MSLTISAYEKLVPLTGDVDDYGDPISSVTGETYEFDEFVRVLADEVFEHSTAGLVEDRDYLPEGDRFTFEAGTHEQYGDWREWLARMSGWELSSYEDLEGIVVSCHTASALEADGGPFWELICFSDREGVLGPVACAKLAADFLEHDALAEAAGTEYEYAQYGIWRESFELAALHGAVVFQ